MPQEREIRETHLQAVRDVARRVYRTLPKNVGVDLMDLESAGNLALVEVVREPASGTVTDAYFVNKVRIRAKCRMIDEVRRITHRGKSHLVGSFPTCRETGELVPVQDRTADCPAALAEARETVALYVAQYDLPSPAAAAAKAAALLAAVQNAISVIDIQEIVRVQVERAKEGSLAAARFVLQLAGG